MTLAGLLVPARGTSPRGWRRALGQARSLRWIEEQLYAAALATGVLATDGAR